MSDTVIQVGHSPDPDDAFMVWALAEGIVHAEDFDVQLVAKDIETLNKWAIADQRLEATALSAAAFARVADKYWLLPHGASFGDGYGPIVVANRPMTLDELSHITIAAPGELTSAWAAMRLAAPHVKAEHKAFDKIIPLIKKGDHEAGLIIHEGQLTWEQEGLHKVLDLGAWWKQETGLPLPLGVVALRKDLGPRLGEDVNALLRASIETGLVMRKRALAYAQTFGRGLPLADADRFVQMYVNALTVDMGERGREAVDVFLGRCAKAGIVPAHARVEMAP
ncbi:MAG: MqnA/MqnD/SBP family protein [Candidatus Thermoplasmatota archaeon]